MNTATQTTQAPLDPPLITGGFMAAMREQQERRDVLAGQIVGVRAQVAKTEGTEREQLEMALPTLLRKHSNACQLVAMAEFCIDRDPAFHLHAEAAYREARDAA